MFIYFIVNTPDSMFRDMLCQNKFDLIDCVGVLTKDLQNRNNLFITGIVMCFICSYWKNIQYSHTYQR